MKSLSTEPAHTARDVKPVAIGECQRLADLLVRYPAAIILGLENNKDKQGPDVVIGLNGTLSKPVECLRTHPDLLLGTFVWCEIRSKDQLPQLQKLIRRVSSMMNAPLVPVH